MLKFAKLILTSSIWVALLSGCALYYPQTADIAFLQEKGELQVSAGGTVMGTLNSTINYGLTNKLAIQAYGNTWPQFGNFYTHGALGYFNNTNNGWSYEVFGGAGYGEGVYQENNKEGQENKVTGNYNMYFGQFNYGMVAANNGTLDFGLSLKGGFIDCDVQNYNTIGYDEHQSDNIFIEPTAFARIGGGGEIKLSFKVGGLLAVPINNENYMIPYSPLNAGISLSYRFIPKNK